MIIFGALFVCSLVSYSVSHVHCPIEMHCVLHNARIRFCILQPSFAPTWIPRSMGLCESLPTEWVARQTTSVTMDLNLSECNGGGVRPTESGLERHPLANVRNTEQGQTRRKYFHTSLCNWIPPDLHYSWQTYRESSSHSLLDDTWAVLAVVQSTSACGEQSKGQPANGCEEVKGKHFLCLTGLLSMKLVLHF